MTAKRSTKRPPLYDEKTVAEFLQTCVETLPLSARAKTCLSAYSEVDAKDRAWDARRLGPFRTVNDLLQWQPQDLLKIKNFGRVSLKEVENLLQIYGLHLGQRRQVRAPNPLDEVLRLLTEARTILELLQTFQPAVDNDV